MNLKNISRKEKEEFYIKKMTELQNRWKNPIDSEWNFSDWTDTQLDESINITVGQLRFEKGFLVFKIVVIAIFVLIIINFFRS